MHGTAAPAPQARLAVEVWIDLTCPWCYLAKRRLERAVHAFEHPQAVQVRYRSFERDAAASRAPDTAQEAAAARRAAAGEGLDLRADGAVPVRTFDAHRLMHLGEAEGGLALQAAVAERMFSAHFHEGKALDDRRVLQRVGPEAGLDEHRVAAVLSGEEYADAVREDEREAARLELTTVPYVLANRRVAVAGPQPVQVLLDLLREAWHAGDPGSSSA